MGFLLPNWKSKPWIPQYGMYAQCDLPENAIILFINFKTGIFFFKYCYTTTKYHRHPGCKIMSASSGHLKTMTKVKYPGPFALLPMDAPA